MATSDRLQQFAAIESNLIQIQTRIQRLAYVFAVVAERSTTDEGLIDELVVSASQLTAAAENLKLVVFDPAENDPDAP